MNNYRTITIKSVTKATHHRYLSYYHKSMVWPVVATTMELLHMQQEKKEVQTGNRTREPSNTRGKLYSSELLGHYIQHQPILLH